MAGAGRARTGLSPCATPEAAIARLVEIYDASCAALRRDFDAYAKDGAAPDLAARAAGAYRYPKLAVSYRPDGPPPPISRAFGKFAAAGDYAATIARPRLFTSYLKEQLSLLVEQYDCEIFVGPGEDEIPYPYAIEGAAGIDADAATPSDLARLFPTPDLAVTDDAIANGYADAPTDGPYPLSLFTGPRTDYSLQRIAHYTGTPAEDFQQFILFTNYHRYVDEFVRLGLERLGSDGYQTICGPGGCAVRAGDKRDAAPLLEDVAWRKYQMPAHHLKRPDGMGVSLVNIGVGPSNAKTITDHLAVLRPQCWVMVGHCGGLRHSQRLGDYVLAHAYLRYDNVLDADLAPEIPVPPIAEVQLALAEAAGKRAGSREELKRRMRTGTVVTNSDRNWELRYSEEARRFNQSRAIAVDMESATIAANGFRFRVPYGTLLCVSDKPLHGEIKLPGAANRFYERAISEHMAIGLEAIELLAKDGGKSLHSRKLRSFDEPPFR
ncbi:MAG: AMP nucleosidase [Pseudomonadota bacterium]